MAEKSKAMNSLKHGMQIMKKELERYKILYEEECQKQEKAIRKRNDAENEIAALTRKAQQIEQSCAEQTHEIESLTAKLDEAVKLADESERARRALDNRKNLDEERISVLEQMVKEASDIAIDAERKYDEVSRKLLLAEGDLEKAEERADSGTSNTKELEKELRAVTNKLKSLQMEEEKFSQRESRYEVTVNSLQQRLQNAEKRSGDSDNLVEKLQREIDEVQEALLKCKSEYRSLREELEYGIQQPTKA